MVQSLEEGMTARTILAGGVFLALMILGAVIECIDYAAVHAAGGSGL